jgi:CBS domain-containing protein
LGSLRRREPGAAAAMATCGEILVVAPAERPIGVVTDRDNVCRMVAEGKNPLAYPAEPACPRRSSRSMRMPRWSVWWPDQIRRVPVVTGDGGEHGWAG